MRAEEVIWISPLLVKRYNLFRWILGFELIILQLGSALTLRYSFRDLFSCRTFLKKFSWPKLRTVIYVIQADRVRKWINVGMRRKSQLNNNSISNQWLRRRRPDKEPHSIPFSSRAMLMQGTKWPGMRGQGCYATRKPWNGFATDMTMMDSTMDCSLLRLCSLILSAKRNWFFCQI